MDVEYIFEQYLALPLVMLLSVVAIVKPRLFLRKLEPALAKMNESQKKNTILITTIVVRICFGALLIGSSLFFLDKFF